jgi:hypothetical protein
MTGDNDSGDEVQGLAGWMYTDLLLGLMVVFLATISFVPKTIADLPQKQVKPVVTSSRESIKVKTPRIIDEVNFIAEFSRFNESEFTQKLLEFRSAQGVSSSAKVLGGQLIGSYSFATENTGTGIDRALEFGLDLERAYGSLLKGVDVDVETFLSDEPKVLVRLTFERK